MSKIAITKKSNTIFLATVLIVGTIAGISPSFIIGINAQTEPYYGMDERYSDYKQDYGMDSYDKKSYEPKPTPYGNDRDYVMDSDTKSYESNSYGSTDYRDNKDRKSYGSDSYKPQYPSYDKYDRDKSKKDSSSKSVSINKIKCINTNININGNNTGNINLGNKGEGYLGAYSTNGNGGYSGDDGYSKQSKGFDCIINNNNTNINLVGGGSQTEPLTCEECFTENLSVEQLNNLTDVLSRAPYQNLEGLCEVLSNTTIGTNQIKLVILVFIFNTAGITDEDTILRVLKCLDELGIIIVPPDFGLPNSMR